MDFLTTFKTIFSNPTKFFKDIEKEKGIKEAFYYVLVLGAFSAVLNVVVIAFLKKKVIGELTAFFPNLPFQLFLVFF